MSAGGTSYPMADGPSANDRLKARWRAYVGRATLLAVIVHAAVFGFAPGWLTPSPPERTTGYEGLSLVALPPLDALNGATGALPEPLPVLAEGGEIEGRREISGGAVTRADEADVMDLWDAIGERLRRRGALVPAIAEPEEEPAADVAERAAEATGEDDLEIGGDAFAVELSDLPEPGSLDLDRLAALRPELALQMASAWVLIRNPVEVEAFLRRGYVEGPLDPNVTGSVSVTLWIDERGSVQWAEISESSGHRTLDEYALAVFNEVAAFRAAREGGVSVSRSVTLSVNFPW